MYYLCFYTHNSVDQLSMVVVFGCRVISYWMQGKKLSYQ